MLSGCSIFVSIEIRGKLGGWVFESTRDPYDPYDMIIMPFRDTPSGYRPLPGAAIEVYDYYSGKLEAEAISNAEGGFYFRSVSPGKKLVVIRHPCDSTVKVEIRVYIRDSIRLVTSKPTVHYIIVGIDKYPKMRGSKDLKVSANDARNIKQVFVDENDVVGSYTLLIDSKATKNNIKNAIIDAAWEAKSGDALVFYFSGYADKEIWEGGVANPLDHIVPYDGQNYGSKEQIRKSVITDKELADWLSRFPNKNVTVILDVAYAQTFFDGTVRAQNVDEIQPLALLNKGYTVLGATSSDERNIVTPGSGSKFTEFIIKGIREISSNRITAGELFDFVDEEMYKLWLRTDPKDRDKVPHPQMVGNENTVIFIRKSYYR